MSLNRKGAKNAKKNENRTFETTDERGLTRMEKPKTSGKKKKQNHRAKEGAEEKEVRTNHAPRMHADCSVIARNPAWRDDAAISLFPEPHMHAYGHGPTNHEP